MPKTSKTKISAGEIAEKATRGEDISPFFTNKFTVVRPVKRANVDLTSGNRQAVIKMLLGRALDQERRGKKPRR